MESHRSGHKAAAQRQSVWARRASSVRLLAERMPGFADEDQQTADALAEYLSVRRATLYRRFGQSPLRGAYVLACCQHLYAPWRALLICREHAGDFPGLWRSRRRAIRGLAYVFIAAIRSERRLFERGLAASRAGAMVREVDLAAIIGPERACPPHTALDLDPDELTPRPFQSIPLLEDAVAGLLSFLGLPSGRAPDLTRKILEVAISGSGSNVMGEANKVLAWASASIEVADEHTAELEAMWLATQLAEHQALSDPSGSVHHLVHLLGSAVESY